MFIIVISPVDVFYIHLGCYLNPFYCWYMDILMFHSLGVVFVYNVFNQLVDNSSKMNKSFCNAYWNS